MKPPRNARLRPWRIQTTPIKIIAIPIRLLTIRIATLNVFHIAASPAFLPRVLPAVNFSVPEYLPIHFVPSCPSDRSPGIFDTSLPPHPIFPPPPVNTLPPPPPPPYRSPPSHPRPPTPPY